jgi:F0F1-type ATP synthase membrane subunit c/vacuolar-type H+-ATPase subunit K
MIQSVAPQPSSAASSRASSGSGFALTEAVVFYGLLGSILAFVLV